MTDASGARQIRSNMSNDLAFLRTALSCVLWTGYRPRHRHRHLKIISLKRPAVAQRTDSTLKFEPTFYVPRAGHVACAGRSCALTARRAFLGDRLIFLASSRAGRAYIIHARQSSVFVATTPDTPAHNGHFHSPSLASAHVSASSVLMRNAHDLLPHQRHHDVQLCRVYLRTAGRFRYETSTFLRQCHHRPEFGRYNPPRTLLSQWGFGLRP